MTTGQVDIFYPPTAAYMHKQSPQRQQSIRGGLIVGSTVVTPDCNKFSTIPDSISYNYHTLDSGIGADNGGLFDQIDETASLEQQFSQFFGISMHTVHLSDTYSILVDTQRPGHVCAQDLSLSADQLDERCNAFLQQLNLNISVGDAHDTAEAAVKVQKQKKRSHVTGKAK